MKKLFSLDSFDGAGDFAFTAVDAGVIDDIVVFAFFDSRDGADIETDAAHDTFAGDKIDHIIIIISAHIA